jgi:tRNA A-37 threonylcarbamoyl transferase component Bud32
MIYEIALYNRMTDPDFPTFVRSIYEPKGYTVSPLGETSHTNVMLIQRGSERLVAKGIFHVDGNAELGPEQRDQAFEVERRVLEMLPKWWGIQLVDSFRSPKYRVIVTPYLKHCKWRDYNGSHSFEIAQSLWKQLKWLKEHGIAHNDLELKNVLMNCDFTRAHIIDFEKATFSSGADGFQADIDKLLRNLEEHEEYVRIARHLRQLASGRRHSVGGRRMRKTRRKGTRKSRR